MVHFCYETGLSGTGIGKAFPLRQEKRRSIMLKGKTVLLGVSGSIAAYKAANLASMLVKLHADVHVIMTKNATNFIHPITFETFDL